MRLSQRPLSALSAAGHTYEVVGMIWMQGESDSTSAYANAYQQNLTDLIAQVRSRYGLWYSLCYRRDLEE